MLIVYRSFLICLTIKYCCVRYCTYLRTLATRKLFVSPGQRRNHSADGFRHELLTPPRQHVNRFREGVYPEEELRETSVYH